MISDKCKMQAAITTIVVMAALALHQKSLTKKLLNKEEILRKENTNKNQS